MARRDFALEAPCYLCAAEWNDDVERTAAFSQGGESGISFCCCSVYKNAADKLFDPFKK